MAYRIYADTSAVAKLFLSEPESGALRDWLGRQTEPQFISSALLGVELVRLLAMISPKSVPAAESFLANDVAIMEITPPILADATTMPPVRLRALDSIHLATAVDLGDAVDVLLTYDKELLGAARQADLAVAAPGAPYA